MISTIAALETWLASLPLHGDFVQISNLRSYAHREEDYDQQYGVDSEHLNEGQGLWALLKKEGIEPTAPALEIGCGTGFLTTGLSVNCPAEMLLVTDPSPAFLRITKQRLVNSGRPTEHLRFAVLNAEDLHLLPKESFGVITLRSTLHHILDVEKFVAQSANALTPGGALAMCAEPIESGYVLMGAVGQAVEPTLTAAGVQILPAWREQIRNFGATMQFYCRRDIDKTTAEDKHLFQLHELAELGAKHQLRLSYFANASLADFTSNAGRPHRHFSQFFLSYLKFCMSFDPTFLALIEEHLMPQLKYIDDCYAAHDGPLFTGVLLFRKNGTD